MDKTEIEIKIERLAKEIDDAQRRLAHIINRRRELQRLDARNKSYQLQLDKKYAAETESWINTIRGLKSELKDLEDILLAME